MIIEALCSFFATFLSGSIGLVTDFVSIPISLVNVLTTITGYGAYFIGSDLLLIIFACITFWLGVKLTLGTLIFIWRLLPFT